MEHEEPGHNIDEFGRNMTREVFRIVTKISEDQLVRIQDSIDRHAGELLELKAYHRVHDRELREMRQAQDQQRVRLSELSGQVNQLETRVISRFEALDTRFEALDGRVGAVESKVDKLGANVDRILVHLGVPEAEE